MESFASYAQTSELPPEIDDEVINRFEDRERISSVEILHEDKPDEFKPDNGDNQSFTNGEASANGRAQELLNEDWHFDRLNSQVDPSPSHDRIVNGESVYEGKDGLQSRTNDILATGNPEFISSHQAMLGDLTSKGWHELPSYNDGKNIFLTICYIDREGYLFYLTLQKEVSEDTEPERETKIVELAENGQEQTTNTDIDEEISLYELLKNSLRDQLSEEATAEVGEEELFTETAPLWLSLEAESTPLEPAAEEISYQAAYQEEDRVQEEEQESIPDTTTNESISFEMSATKILELTPSPIDATASSVETTEEMPADYLLTESDNTLSIPEASVEQPVFFKEKVQPQIKVERPDTFDTDTYIEKKAESTETTHFKTELIIQDPSINTASNELSQQPVTETSFTEVPLNFIDPAPADTSEVISFEKAITQPATEEIFTQTNHVEIPNTSQEITATIIDTETTALESKITPQEEIPGPTIEPAQDILASPKHALRELLKPETPLNIQTIGPLSEKAPIPITKFTRQESKPAAIEQITVAKSEDSFHTEIIFESPVEKRSKETLEVTAEPQPITQEIITMDPAEVSQTALRERVVVKRDVKEQQPEPAREIFAPVIIERNKKILDADKKNKCSKNLGRRKERGD
jgi:hypothetical protein